MKQAGLGLGLGLMALAFLPACAGTPLRTPEQGFHPASPYRQAPPSATLAQREALFRSYRVTVNPMGFQVGSVPLDAAQLEAYMAASGATDLAAGLTKTRAKVEGWETASDLAHGIIGEAASPLLPVVSLLSAVAEDEASAYAAAAKQYNARVLQALRLPLGQDALVASKRLPAPLESRGLAVGMNASMDDLVWERSIFVWPGRPSRIGLFPSHAGSGTYVGGTKADIEQLQAHMRSYGSEELAERYGHHQRLANTGSWLAGLGSVCALGGLVATLFLNPPFQPWTAIPIAVGTIAMPVGFILSVAETSQAHDDIDEFNAKLPGRLELRLGLPISVPSDRGTP